MRATEGSRSSAELEPEGSGSTRRDRLIGVGTAVGGVGGALGAVLSALCCVGSTGAALLGAGGALAAPRLERYRPIMLVASLALIGFGFVRAYRRGNLPDGAACPAGAGRTVRILLWVAAAIWIAAALLPVH
jgi:hypothetical protein